VKHLETIIISTIILAVIKQCGSDAATIELILKLFLAWLWVSIKNEKLEAFCHFVTNAQTNLSGMPDGCQDH